MGETFKGSFFKLTWQVLNDSHVMNCLGFFVFKVVLPTVDVVTDVSTAIDHFSKGNKYWGIFTLLPIFFPFVARLCWGLMITSRFCCSERTGGYSSNGKSMTWETLTSPLIIMGHLPGIQTIRNLRLWFGLFSMDTTLESNWELTEHLKLQAINFGILEAFLESAPQLILQSYIVIHTGEISYSQIIGMPISFVSLSYASVGMFFSQRLQPEANPSILRKLCIYPLVFIQLLGPLMSLVLMSLYFREFIFLAILFIVLLNSLTTGIYLKQNYLNLKGEYEIWSETKSRWFKQLTLRVFFTSVLTSWISASATITVIFSLIGNLTSQLGHALCIGIIFMILSKNILIDTSRLPFTHCIPYSEIGNSSEFCFRNLTYLMRETVVATKCTEMVGYQKIFRVCQDNEMPSDLFCNYLGPAAVALVILPDVIVLILWVNLCYLQTCLEQIIENVQSWGEKISANGTTTKLIKEPLIHKLSKNDISLIIACCLRGQLFSEDENGVVAIQYFFRNMYTQKHGAKHTLMLLHLLQHQNMNSQNYDDIMSSSKLACKYWLNFITEAGINITKQSTDGSTAVHLAAAVGDVICLQQILNGGGSLEIRDKNGQTPIHYASHHGNYQCLQLLIQHLGHDSSVLHQQNIDGHNPLHLAKNPKCLKILLQKASLQSVNQKDNNRLTPLHIASLYFDSKCIELLVKKGASVNEQDRTGRTALHNVTKNGDYTCIQQLINCNADVNITDRDGDTPLHLLSFNHKVSESCMIQCCEALMKAGADLTIRNKMNQTALKSNLSLRVLQDI